MAVLVAVKRVRVGLPVVVEGRSPNRRFAVVFEDDGETGYLYAVDLRKKEDAVLDAVQIYNVKDVADREEESAVQLVWSSDGLKGALYINEYLHAVFDFE